MNKKVLKITLEVGIIIATIIAFILINESIIEKKRRSFISASNIGDYAYQVETVDIINDELVIKGWFFELKKVRNIEKNVQSDKNLGIILWDITQNKEDDSNKKTDPKEGIALKVERTTRNDVNNYFKCEYDYSHCGFTAKINYKELDLVNAEYQIIFKPDEEMKAGIPGNAFLSDGKLSYVKTTDIMPLDVYGSDLEEIVKNGFYVAGCPESHVAIYQYEWSLYWIMDEKYKFETNGSTYIQYQMGTTQFDKLPKNRTDNGWYWSNIGGYFEDYEITNDISCGSYRVCKRDIPMEYSIVSISTGYYVDDAYVWNREIRPVYVFDKK